MSFFQNFFKSAPAVDLAVLMEQGATVVDVRTPAEYATGHVSGSVNIPLDRLHGALDRIRKDRPVITCCASGMRSSSAARTLRAGGFDAHNGGAWTTVERLRTKR